MAKRLNLYANIVRALAEYPETAAQVAQRHGSCMSATLRILRRLHDMRVIRVCGWTRQHLRSPDLPIYSFSDGDDVPRPPCRTTGKPSRSPSVLIERAKPSPELTAFAALIHALREPSTLNDLVETTGLHYNSLRRTVKHMRSIRLVYVAGWEKTAGDRARMFRVGVNVRDKEKPRPEPIEKTQRRYRHARAERERMLLVTRALAAQADTFTLAQAAA